MIEAEALSAMGTAMGLGLGSSLTICALSCLPFIGGWVLGRERDASSSLRDAWLFLLGRLSAYVTLGGAAGVLGAGWESALDPYPLRLAGCLLILWSGWRVWKGEKRSRCQGGEGVRVRDASPFALGLAQAMTPCVPLSALLALCAASSDPAWGATLAFCFGAGAMVSPLLLATPVVAEAGRALTVHLWSGAVRGLAAALLMLLGVRQLWMA